MECSVQLKDGQAQPGEVFFVITWLPEGGSAQVYPTGSAPCSSQPHGHYGSQPLAALPLSQSASHGGVQPVTPHVCQPYYSNGVAPRIAQTFAHFDINRSGYLDYHEVRNALLQICAAAHARR